MKPDTYGKGGRRLRIKKAVIRHRVIDFLKEFAVGVLSGIVIGAGFWAVFFLYCKMAGPLIITFK